LKPTLRQQKSGRLDRLRESVETVMHGHHGDRSALSGVLRGAAAVYGTAVRLRAKRFRQQRLLSHRLPCRVISVGNITLGGTGKTPMSVYLAQLLHAAGHRVAVVSRGYKGLSEKKGGIVSDGQRLLMAPSVAGDEPYLMARQLLPGGIPVIVGQDRVRSGLLAIRRFHTEVIVLDDGFQHLRLQRDLDIVLLDATNPFGNGYLLPRGTLREPLSSLSRSDICLLTRCPPAMMEKSMSALATSLEGLAADNISGPIFAAAHTPFIQECLGGGCDNPPDAKLNPGDCAGEPVFAFSGLARNDAFVNTLRDMGFELKGSLAFSDHHVYSRGEIEAIASQADRKGARWLLTTEKDRVKIDPDWIHTMPLWVVGIRMDLGGRTKTFEQLVMQKLFPSSC